MSPIPVSAALSPEAKWEHDSSTAASVVDVEEPGLWSRCSLVQVIYGLWANQVILCTGLAFGFSAVTVPQLKSSTSLNSWVASVLMLTSSIGCIICGYILDHFGRRNMMVICMAPMAVGWFLTGMAEDTRGMIYGRIVTGIGVGMAATPPRVYCTEIALPKMRAVLGALPTLAMALGIFLQGVLSLTLSWNIVCTVCGVHATLIMVINILLPESPYYVLLSKQDMFETRKSIMLFRSRDYDFEPELDTLATFKTKNRIRKLSLIETLKYSFTHETFKPFIILVMYCVISELSGSAVLKFWSVAMLVDVNEPLESVFTGNLTFGLTRIFAAALLVICIFYMNRRPTAIATALTVALLCSVLSMYLMTGTRNSLIPRLGFMLLIVVGTFGPYTLPMLMIFEIIPLEVRGFLGSIAVMIQHLVIFGVVKTFPYARKWMGFPQTILCFGMMSFIGTIFVYFLLPETRGLSLLEIESHIEGRRKRLELLKAQKSRKNSGSKVSFSPPITLASNHVQQDTQTDQTNQINRNV